jgi:hypothetical protein
MEDRSGERGERGSRGHLWIVSRPLFLRRHH